jgi:hypothetical protein
VAGSGVLFRIRPTAKTGRSVQRSGLFDHLSDVDHLLQGIDLRAGDEENFPRRDEPQNPLMPGIGSVSAGSRPSRTWLA